MADTGGPRKKNVVRQIAEELSSLLAGFKLALIVMSYVGFGSLAKWVIEHWYPFTRNVWDLLTHALNLPSIPIAVKDSLTALVFFLPLGITALWQRINKQNAPTNDKLKVLAALLGILFFFMVTKDVISAIVSELGGLSS